jgi:hypothetical protein
LASLTSPLSPLSHTLLAPLALRSSRSSRSSILKLLLSNLSHVFLPFPHSPLCIFYALRCASLPFLSPLYFSPLACMYYRFSRSSLSSLPRCLISHFSSLSLSLSLFPLRSPRL